jgi:hypothetical protein
MSSPDQPEFIPPEQIIQPEDMTDEMLKALAPVMFPKFMTQWSQDLESLCAKAMAAATQDDELKTIRHELKDREIWINRWAGRLGDQLGAEVSEYLKDLERRFRKAGDDILAALMAEPPPEQGLEGEGWKNA